MTTEQNPIDALRQVPRRSKIHDTAINVKIPHEVKELIENIASDEGVSGATVVRWAIGDYLKAKEGEL